MIGLIIASLAVFWAWETFLVLLPWVPPPWLQPLLVVAGSLAFVWPDWRIAMAVAGVVGLLHVAVRDVGRVVQIPGAVRRPSRLPNLP